jgi:thiosulfate dehydrogenase
MKFKYLYFTIVFFFSLNLFAFASEVATAPYSPPAKNAIPNGPMGDSIRYGYKVLTETQTYLKNNVGNGLNCTNCHLDGGRTKNSSPFVGLWGVFPEYNKRDKALVSIEDRINDCFKYSMNGKVIQDTNSKEMMGMISYIWWLSQGVPTGVSVAGRGIQELEPPKRKPDMAIGKALFASKCSSCHGAEGQGVRTPAGNYIFPPLWGNQSFNSGAGMAKLNTAAAFIKWNMPLGQGGSLSNQDAYDIASYFTQKPRPQRNR